PVPSHPPRGTRRVYIIDEAHQLSKAAFNALLKTIEEPPAHVLFVFCTTETHQMMATVRDRCQRIAMRSPGPEALIDVLHRVAKQEGIEADDAALRAVARAAQGSFRNALGTLEMLTTTFGKNFTRDAVLQHLGVVAEETLFEATDALIAGNAGDALRLVDRLVQEGVDLDQFARSLAEHLRGVLLELHGVGESAGVGDPARLTEQAARADELRVLAAIDCIADAATRIRVGSDARISIETALVRASQGLGLPLLAVRLASLEQKIAGGYGLPVAGGAASAAPPAAIAAPAPPTPAPAAPVSSVPAVSAEQLADTRTWWTQVVLNVSAAHRPAVVALEVVSASPERVTMSQVKPGLSSPKFREQLTQSIRAVVGHPVAIDIHPYVAPAAPASASSAPPHPPSAPAAPTTEPVKTTAAAPITAGPDLTSDAGVANVMSMFDAVPVTPGAKSSDE
ncbi:MAG: hypothetical protein H7287_04935, partial [Thermoleophilia bacterium]|nr:hypothetical protein [Thermoleophilia bacterium]